MQNPSIKCFPPVLQHKLERRFCRGGFIKYSDGGRVSLSSVIARFEKEAIQQNKCVSLPLVPLLVVNYKKILKHIPQLEDLVVGPRNNYLLEQFNIEQWTSHHTSYLWHLKPWDILLSIKETETILCLNNITQPSFPTQSLLMVLVEMWKFLHNPPNPDAG